MMCATVTLAGIAVGAGCGSSGDASATVPATAGRSVSRAIDALSGSGVRVTVNLTLSPAAPASGAARADDGLTVTGMTPPAGTPVTKGAVVVLQEAGPNGVEADFATTANCLAPVFRTITTSAAGRAAIKAVATSSAGRAAAGQLPMTQASETCTVVRPAPATPAPMPATCSTYVSGGGGPEIVTYSEAWSGTQPGRDVGIRSWSFLVQPHHVVELATSSGDPPRRVVR